MDDELQRLRSRIDEINIQLLDLFNERAVLSKQIGLEKRKQGKSLYDPKREEEIMKKIVSLNKGPYEDQDIETIFKEIFKTSLRLQERAK